LQKFKSVYDEELARKRRWDKLNSKARMIQARFQIYKKRYGEIATIWHNRARYTIASFAALKYCDADDKA